MGLTEGDVAASRGWILRLHGQLGAQGRSYRERVNDLRNRESTTADLETGKGAIKEWW